MTPISIVIPVHNEDKNVEDLAEEINIYFQKQHFEWEVIWVNDCSTDETQNVLENIASMNPHHKIVNLTSRNGQSSAVLTGIHFSNYSVIGTLDGDGQNSPRDLLMLKQLLEDTGILLAQGVRIDRHDSKVRRISTKLANFVRNNVLNIHLNDVGCAVRVFRKDALIGLPSFKGWHRFLPVMLSIIHPDKVLEFPVSHRERRTGTTKYGINNRLWVGLFDLVGMLWFKKRVVKFTCKEEVQWKNSFTQLGSQVNSFSPVESLHSG